MLVRVELFCLKSKFATNAVFNDAKGITFAL